MTKVIEQMTCVASPKESDDHFDNLSKQEEIDADSVSLVNIDNDTQYRSEVKSNLEHAMETEETAYDDNARHNQPTENSSLEAARAFFRFLDTNHRLVVDPKRSPRASSKVVRTTRRIRHSDQLLVEYCDYCNILAQTGVVPISITEFASNWNNFVAKGIRDGLFDEA